MKIGIDLDDVLCNTIPEVVYFYNKKYSKNITFEDIKSFNLWEIGVGNNKDESVHIVEEFDKEVGFENIELLPGVKEAIPELSKIGEIFFITSRSNNFHNKTKSYLWSNFQNINYKLIYSNDFHNINGNKKKFEICKELGIDIFIDDNKDYILDCSKEGIKCFLINKPWNKNFEENDRIIRVNDWKEILHRIKIGGKNGIS